MIDFASAYLGIIKEFNWRHVVILLQDENLYTLVYMTIYTRMYSKTTLDQLYYSYCMHVLHVETRGII